MTLVYELAIIEVKNGHTRQLTLREVDTIMEVFKQIHGDNVSDPATFQSFLESYWRKKGGAPLLVVDILL